MSQTKNPSIAVCTIASRNYLAHVRTLAESFKRFHPDAPMYFLLVDRLDGAYDPEAEAFITVSLDELGIPNLPAFCFQYTILELNTAVKPFLLEHLFRRKGVGRLLYFDPDIKFYAPVTPLFEALEHANVVLLPHLTQPLRDEARPSELDILRSGAYNLGFVGLAHSRTTERLLEWWQDKLRKYCLADVSQGLFTDQRWMDLVPGMFEGTRIIRDPGYDVAYWNLQHRTLSCDDGAWRANGEPLRFFHFSGFDPADREAVSKHQDRYRLRDVPCLPQLFEDYAVDLARHGYAGVKNVPYAFDYFSDGTRIPDIARRVYLRLDSEITRFGDPFRADGEGSFISWLNAPAEGTGKDSPVITKLALEVYRSRPDLQAAFPLLTGEDRVRYTTWLAGVGRRQHNLDDAFIDALENPPEAQIEAQRLQAAQPTGDAGRRRLVTTLARAGIGRVARKVLGAGIANRIRDRMLWGRAAATMPLPDIKRRAKAADERREVGGSFGLNVVGSLCSESGVGEAARAVVRAAHAANVPLAGTRVDYAAPQRTNEVSCADLTGGNPHAVNLFCVNADRTPVVVQAVGAGFLENRVNIGYWFWELEHFPEEWYDRFDHLDEVWVASSFCQDAVSRVSPIPVAKIPLSVEVGPAATPPPEVLDIPPDRFLFFFMFDYHSFPERKNPLAALRAFQQAFPPDANVHLLLKGTDSRADPAYHARLVAEARTHQVTIIDRYLDRDIINGLMQRCNCYVSLHRSEGFGITPAEAMYLGKPVIATAYSGNMDFMRPDNSYLVRYRMVEIDKDHGPYKKGWLWAEPDVDHAAQVMARVFGNREEAAQVAARGVEEIRSRFSPAGVGRRIEERLQRLRVLHGGSAQSEQGGQSPHV